MKAYKIDNGDIKTLCLEGVKRSEGHKCGSDVVYYPFDSDADVTMALEVLKDAGVKVELA